MTWLKSLRRTVRFARQRVFRGWDDSATWSLDVHLCHTLGAQLTHLAETSHGYPADTTEPKWESDLHYYGILLKSYDPDNEYRLEVAQGALRWVADHLPDLWD